MDVLRSEPKATRCLASGLRAGSAVARTLGGSRAGCPNLSVALLSGRGPRVPLACRLVRSARAVPGWRASPLGPAASGARPSRLARGRAACSRRERVGV